MVLLARNRVTDFERWKQVFDAQDSAARASGLVLTQLWRDADDPNNVFFAFDVADRARAEAFMSSPTAQAAGAESGVIDGDYNFLTEVA